MRLISIDGNYKLPTDWKEEVNILSVLILGVSVLRYEVLCNLDTSLIHFLMLQQLKLRD